jgi:hypothetical protein
MIERVLARLTVCYHGAPIGTTSLVERRVSKEEIQRIHKMEFPPVVDPEPRVLVWGFEPLPGYTSVAPIVHRAREASKDPGFRGLEDEAWAAREAFVAELELFDENGQLLPARIGMLDEGVRMGERAFFFEGQVEEAAAGVVARLRQRQTEDGNAEPPAA